MRLLRLAQVAAAAESLRLRYAARRALQRGAVLAVAVLFLAFAIAFAQGAAFMWLALVCGPAWAALILAGCDLVIGLALLLLSARSRPGAVEREARQVRDKALAGMTRPASILALILPVADALVRWRCRRDARDGGEG
jgi:hypothetical protein